MNILARDPEIQARIQTNVPARVPVVKIPLNFHLIYFLNTTPNTEHNP